MSRRRFQGSTVVISGAGGGLGRALAQRFAADGARLALLDRDRAGVEETAAGIRNGGGEALALECDVTDVAGCAQAVQRAVEHYGRIDVLINNAGIPHRSPFAQTDLAVVQRVMNVNFLGAVQLTHAALPHLVRSRGAIAAVSSVAGFSPLIARTAYAASKHALHGFFASLRTEVRTQGIDVTLACPSFIATGIDRNALGADGRPARHAQVVIGRRMTPGHVADRIVKGLARRRPLLLIGATAHQAWWLSRLAPSLFERIMARRLRGEMQPD